MLDESADLRGLLRVRRLAEQGVARALRLEAGLSLAEMAAAVGGVDRTTIHKWERCVRRPRGPAALRYLSVLEELAAR